MAKWFGKVREVLTKAGQSQFTDGTAQRSAISSAMIPQGRSLSLGEIMATGGTGYIRDISPNYWFGPLQPINPTAPSTYRPRQYPYTPGSNIIWTPKGESPISFDTLRALADSWDLLRIVIETQKDRICKTRFLARAKMGAAGEARTKWEERNAKDPTVKALNDFLLSPDGFHDLDTWIRMLLEDMIVCDATAMWMERDLQGRIASVHPIAGDTINRLLTDQGLTPAPPSKAYQQVVYGTPACDLTTDDLLYYMRNERTNRRYGFSPVEQILITISIGLRRQEFQLQYYTSGNVPEALCFLPGDLPADKVKEYQEFFDAMLAGDLSKRRRLTFLPGFGGDSGKAQSTVQFTKDVLLKDEMDEWLARVACLCIGISPQAFIKQMNRAGAQQQQETSEEEGKEPYVKSLLNLMNNLVQNKMGLKLYEIIREDDQELDLLKQAQADNLSVGKIITVNEARKRRGLDSYSAPEADQLGTWSPAIGFIPLGEVANALTSDKPQKPGADEDKEAKDPNDAGPETGKGSVSDKPQPAQKTDIAYLGSRRGEDADLWQLGDQLRSPEGRQGTVTAIDDDTGCRIVEMSDDRSKLMFRPGTRNAGWARFVNTTKGKPNGKANGHVRKAASFRQGSLRQIKAGVLTHTSQEARTAMDERLKRRFVHLHTHAVQAIHAAVKKAFEGVLQKLDVSTPEEFATATRGKTRYSVNHMFDQPLQLRPRGHKPYGPKKQIKEKPLKLADLTPTQYWLKPEIVLAYVDNPTDKPVHVVGLDGQLLVSDGHHRCAAARLRGDLTIQARVFPGWATEAEIERNKKHASYAVGQLAKADDVQDIVDQIMASLQEDFAQIPGDVAPLLQQAAGSGLTQGVVDIDVTDSTLLANANTTAQQWATARAAELVGMQYNADGVLVPNPNADWAITNSTRQKLAAIIEDAFTQQSSMVEIADAINVSGIFDATRADTIAQTEISRAQVFGNLTMWLDSGVVQTVDWLVGENDPCDECMDLADGSPYPIDDTPVPIDDSHPNCACILAAGTITDEEALA